MGVPQSKPEPSTPTRAFGRLSIHSPRRSPRHSSTQQQLNGNAASLIRPASWDNFNTEKTPFLEPGVAAATNGHTFDVPSPPALPDGVIPSSRELIQIGATASPPLMVWIGPALACAMCYALYNIFIKKGSASIHPILGGVILQFVAALLGSILLSVLLWNEHSSKMEGDEVVLQYDEKGIQWSICAGIAVGAAEIISFLVSGMGVQAMQSIPIIIGGSVMFGTVLGFVLLRESLTWMGWFGVVLISIGISMVGMDPAATMASH